MGYAENPMLSALSTLRNKKKSDFQPVIAFISFQRDKSIRDSGPLGFQSLIFESCKAFASAKGYDIQEYWVGEQSGVSAERLNKILLTKRIKGIIVSVNLSEYNGFVLDWDSFCTVTIDNYEEMRGFFRVSSDNYYNVSRCLEKCRKSGYQRIGVCFAKEISERLNGSHLGAYFYQTWSQGVQPVVPFVYEKWDAADYCNWLKSNNVDAVITSSLNINRIISASIDCGYRIPKTLGIASTNTNELIQKNLGDRMGLISGIDPAPKAIGRVAAESVISKILHNDCGSPGQQQTLLVQGKWLEGDTVRAVGCR